MSQSNPQQRPQQPVYPPQYPNNNPNNRFQNLNAQQSNYQYPPQQYPPQGQYPYPYQQQPYPPQGAYQQQQGYPVQNPYQNFKQGNSAQYNQLSQNINQNPNPNQYTQQSLAPPPVIPPNSPLLRHSLSDIVTFVKKNLGQFSPQFQKKFNDNEDFKSLNRKMVFIPSFLIMGHVIMNRNKKWFRLTVNAPLIRRSLIGLLCLHLSTNFLYVAAYRDLISKNRERIQKVIVREQFLSGSGANNLV